MGARNLILLLSLVFITNTLLGQSGPGDNYQGRLYRLCKVWGYVKYYHSNVSQCQVNWDSVLIATIPQVKAATDSNDFNAALLQMLKAAGPMALATTPAPVLDSNAINVDNSWQDDSYFSDSVRTILDTIRNNFRPHSGCYVVNNDYSNPNNQGWLKFPGDSASPIIGAYPEEQVRLQMLFRYWNILKYFNPNSKTTKQPWDTTLLNNVLFVANAPSPFELYKAFLRVLSALNDTHVQSLSYSNSMSYQGTYLPPLIIKYVDSSYIVLKSEYGFLHPGDIIDSFDGLSMHQWEDSLRPYISSSNDAAFHRDLYEVMLSGDETSVNLVYTDSIGAIHNNPVVRNMDLYYWYLYSQAGTDTVTKYKVIGCDLGYVNMGNLQPEDVKAMYDSLGNLPAIIFDIRNYPNETAWDIAPLMLPAFLPAAGFLEPDVTYPGNFYWEEDYFGIDNNPTSYKGTVILLMNEETQSQAEYTCMVLSLNSNVIKIGSQTAGADGNVTYFNLSSDLYEGFTNLGTYYPNGVNAQHTGIVPDVLVQPTIAGIKNGVDEVLDSAVAIACKTTGIEKLENNAFKLYPNPANNYITIEAPANSEALQISINNLLGRQVKEATMNGNISNIDVSNFSSGLYFVSIVDTHGNLLKTMKWVKEGN